MKVYVSYLLFTHCAVLEASVAHDVLVGAGVSAQASLAGPVQQREGGQCRAPADDSKAACDNAVQVARAYWTTEGSRERQAEEGDGGDEVGGSNGEQHQRRHEVGVCGPCHGQFALAQVEVGVAAVDFEGVDQENNNSAAEHNDQQAESGSQAAEPMRVPAHGEFRSHWRTRTEAIGVRLQL